MLKLRSFLATNIITTLCRRYECAYQRCMTRSMSSSDDGKLTLPQLETKVNDGDIQTIVVGFTDIYGRFMGKRFAANFFLQDCVQGGTHVCDYLLACNMSMTPIEGFKFANWERGFGDVHLIPDLNSLIFASWMYKSAIVLCDVHDNKTHERVNLAPRSLLHHQVKQAEDIGFSALAATELEYYMYKTSFDEAERFGYQKDKLDSVSNHVEDYHLLQTSREEPLTARFRYHLQRSGIPVENSKGEAGVGQHELNVKFDAPLAMSDRHVIYKQCLKEVADQNNHSLTFMAKPFHDTTGSGCHVHLSLWKDSKNNAFVGDNDLNGIKCSDTFRWFLGGWLKHTPDCMPFYAPTINSYKRFQSSSWAPTRLAWSDDNRTAGFRIVGSGKNLRIECRIPGADVNPYLIFAASLASGLDGIRQQIEPPPCFSGNIYEARQIQEVPKTLAEAVQLFSSSEFTHQAFGPDVVEHYTHFYRNEQKEFDAFVTDWERERYFEQI